MKGRTSTIVMFGLWAGLVALSGCGYHRAGMGEAIPKSIRIIGIPTLKNSTQQYEIEQRFTQALVREFVARSNFSIVPRESGADAVLRGEIAAVGASPIIFGSSSFGSVFLITIHLRISLVNSKTNKIIYQNNGLIFRDQYAVNVRVLDNPQRVAVEQFFSEENPAIDRVAKDCAASVVTSVLETF